MHLNFGYAVALTGLAATAFDIKAESAGFIAARAGFVSAGEEFAYRRKHSRVGGRVGARCSADGALVDIDTFVDVVQTRDGFVGCGSQGRGTVVFGGGDGVQSSVDQGGFTRGGVGSD